MCACERGLSHWLKVQSMWSKNYIFAKKVYFDQLLDFLILLLLHFIIVPYFTIWMLDFFNTNWVSNSLDPDQAGHSVGPDLGPNYLQRLSADIAGRVKYNATC